MSPRSVCTSVWTSVRGVMPTFLPSRDIFSCAAACRLQTATQAFHQIDNAGRSAWFVGHEFGVRAFELGFDYSHQVFAIVVCVFFWLPLGREALDQSHGQVEFLFSNVSAARKRPGFKADKLIGETQRGQCNPSIRDRFISAVTSSNAVKGMNAWSESNGSDRSIVHASRKSRQASAPAPNGGTSTSRPSCHPTCAGRGRRITTGMTIGEIGLGVEMPSPGRSRR